jgi:hypothetical protein
MGLRIEPDIKFRVEQAGGAVFGATPDNPDVNEDSLLLKIAQVCQRTQEISGQFPVKFIMSESMLKRVRNEAWNICAGLRVCGVQVEVDYGAEGDKFTACIENKAAQPDQKWRETCEPKRTECLNPPST